MVTLQEGKFYRTRDGQKIGPVLKNPEFDNLWGIAGSSLSTHYETGRMNGYRECPGDIIAKWVDEKPQDTSEPLTLHSDGKLIYTSTMTLRDEFAIAAFSGLVPLFHNDLPRSAIAEMAYGYADAMLAARS